MNVLVLNAGSSSLKYQLINVETHEVLAKGICERVGSAEAFHKHGIDENEMVIDTPCPTTTPPWPPRAGGADERPHQGHRFFDDIDAVGHRVVQGGKYFDRSVLIDDDVIAKIDELAELAPLHNKAALMGIEACPSRCPASPWWPYSTPRSSRPSRRRPTCTRCPSSCTRSTPSAKYGAHGTSHRYIAERAAAFMDEPLEDLKLITCHLGNGCSISAIDHGVAVDTSMGLTPLDGLMMGTRCGAIDPAIVPFIMEKENLTTAEVNDLMNKKSGLLGISGISNDLRSVRQASEEGDERAQLAYDMYSNSAKKYIGQYIAVMGGVDAIVLTAGVGENCDKMRRMIFAGLQPLGIKIDLGKNRKGLRGEREISTDDSEVRIVIIPTDEEYMIARDTYQLVKEGTLEITELV